MGLDSSPSLFIQPGRIADVPQEFTLFHHVGRRINGRVVQSVRVDVLVCSFIGTGVHDLIRDVSRYLRVEYVINEGVRQLDVLSALWDAKVINADERALFWYEILNRFVLLPDL